MIVIVYVCVRVCVRLYLCVCVFLCGCFEKLCVCVYVCFFDRSVVCFPLFVCLFVS